MSDYMNTEEGKNSYARWKAAKADPNMVVTPFMNGDWSARPKNQNNKGKTYRNYSVDQLESARKRSAGYEDAREAGKVSRGEQQALFDAGSQARKDKQRYTRKLDPSAKVAAEGRLRSAQRLKQAKADALKNAIKRKRS